MTARWAGLKIDQCATKRHQFSKFCFFHRAPSRLNRLRIVSPSCTRSWLGRSSGTARGAVISTPNGPFSLTRFARDKCDHFVLRSHLQSLGVSLRLATESIDDTCTGKLIEGVLAAFAQFDNDCRSALSEMTPCKLAARS